MIPIAGKVGSMPATQVKRLGFVSIHQETSRMIGYEAGVQQTQSGITSKTKLKKFLTI